MKLPTIGYKGLYVMAALCVAGSALNVYMFIWAGYLFSLIVAVLSLASGVWAAYVGTKVEAYEKTVQRRQELWS